MASKKKAVNKLKKSSKANKNNKLDTDKLDEVAGGVGFANIALPTNVVASYGSDAFDEPLSNDTQSSESVQNEDLEDSIDKSSFSAKPLSENTNVQNDSQTIDNIKNTLERGGTKNDLSSNKLSVLFKVANSKIHPQKLVALANEILNSLVEKK